MSASVSAAAPLLPAGRAQPRRRDVAFLPLHVVLTTLVIAMSLGSIALSVYEFPESHAPIAIVTGIVGAGLIAYARYFLRLPWISAPVVYLILFWVFHFGMTFTAVLVPSVLTKILDEDLEWLSLSSTRMSMILGVVGAASFVFATGFFARRPAATSARQPLETEDEPALYTMGWLLLLTGIALLVVVFAQNGGPAVFSLGILEFRASILATSVLPTAIDIGQLGCLVALCGAGRHRWPRPLAAWGIGIGAPMLLVGLRAAALVPLVTFAVVLAQCGIRLRRGLLATAVLGSLIAIPAISAFRLVGFANRELVSWTEVTPLDTFMELGGSLQATKAYVDWIERGDELLLGASYWAPFDRQVLVRVIPGREPIPYELDERVPVRLMDEQGRSDWRVGHGGGVLQLRSGGPVDLLRRHRRTVRIVAAIQRLPCTVGDAWRGDSSPSISTSGATGSLCLRR